MAQLRQIFEANAQIGMNDQTARWYTLAKQFVQQYPGDSDTNALYRMVRQLGRLPSNSGIETTVRNLVIKLTNKYGQPNRQPNAQPNPALAMA